jgi:uncharacterized protein YycO
MMKIRMNPVSAPVSKAELPAAPAVTAAAPSPHDTVEIKNHAEVNRKALGTSCAAFAAIVGRLTVLPAIGATLLSTVLGSVAGLPGAIAGGIAGASLGLRLELGKDFQGIFPAGRIVGGAIGGLAGALVGDLMGRLGIKLPFSKGLVEETRGFSLLKLFRHLPDASYTSHEKLSESHCQAIQKIIQPGDILVTTQDSTLSTEVPQFLLGGSGEGGWVHGAIYTGDGNLVESNGYFGQVVMRPLKDSLAVSEHVTVLRPHYRDEAQRQEVVADAMRRMGEPYGFDTHLDPSSYYCTEFVYHVLKENAPQIQVEPSKFLRLRAVTGDDLVKSKDMDTLYSTGSSLLHNYLSKFD